MNDPVPCPCCGLPPTVTNPAPGSYDVYHKCEVGGFYIELNSVYPDSFEANADWNRVVSLWKGVKAG